MLNKPRLKSRYLLGWWEVDLPRKNCRGNSLDRIRPMLLRHQWSSVVAWPILARYYIRGFVG
jgi:hypothetical protein